MDGKTHINIYSKGATKLGQWLSNFAYSPIETEDGHFDSIEGYWYWLSCKDDQLRFVHGWKAKALGRKLRGKDWSSETEFVRKIKAAIKTKLDTYPHWANQLKKTTLPLDHYYVYNDVIIRPKSGKWLVSFLENIRTGNTEEEPAKPIPYLF